ncbi:MAG: thermonuclease family protein [Pseudomonadota bacterium]
MIAAALSLFLASSSVLVTDGDTIRLGSEPVRIVGYDSPEIRHAKCPAERAMGQYDKDLLRELLAGGFEYQRLGTDRWGRTLARIWVNGTDVARIMTSRGNAVPYICKGGRCPKRKDWCG